MSLESELKHNTEALRELIEVLRSGAKPADAIASQPIRPDAPVAVVDRDPAPKLVFDTDIRPLAVNLLKNGGRAKLDALLVEFKVAKLSDIADQKTLVKVKAKLEEAGKV